MQDPTPPSTRSTTDRPVMGDHPDPLRIIAIAAIILVVIAIVLVVL